MGAIEERTPHWRTPEVLILLGNDFGYRNGVRYFHYADNMINYMNKYFQSWKGNNYTYQYSTVDEYVKAVHSHDVDWPTKYDDAMPLISDENKAWTGFFSSRANAKGYIRRLSSYHHASQLSFAQKFLDQSAGVDQLGAILDANHAALDAIGVV